MNTPALELDPTALPPGTQVGTWRVEGFRGRGVYGIVYRAVSLLPGSAAKPVALKLAIHPGDRRFEREGELLSRVRCPSVPRLLDSGTWRSSLGSAHPFVVMEWVEGEPLYAWAARRNPTSRQVLAVLAQAARALQATHEVSGVHRDVKGDNMLVRPVDGRLFLTDFGAGYLAGAARLTPWHRQPGTDEYRSVQVWEAMQRAGPHLGASELAGPSDDVFALGVTAYRLVTDTYPPLALPGTEPGKCWLPGGKGIAPPKQLNPRVDAQLNALILRMLSLRPEGRGTAGELAEALERGVAHGGPSAETPLFEWETQPPSRWTEAEQANAEHLGHRPGYRVRGFVQMIEQADTAARARWAASSGSPVTVQARQKRPRQWLLWLAAAMALGLWPEETDSVRTVERLTVAHGVRAEAEQKEEAVSLGDAATSSSDAVQKDPLKKPIAKQVPKEPLPGQRTADAKGRCPGKQIAINGGCWAKVDLSAEECHGGVFFVYRDGCYAPAYESVRIPTSAPGQLLKAPSDVLGPD